ncbi:protein max-like isoform X2 [Rhodnius prolixus]|uniref:protein max-like isoform X2 n=1 Tax=Rhodnius prolixus TaxID=13249 RepID=UPI003D18C705
MSDEDREMDLENAEKRAHHNALERKRRDHIKDSFSSLRDSVPALQGEKVASRAQILKKAADYIQYMRKKNSAHLQDIDDLRRQNNLLEAQIRTLEKSRSVMNFIPKVDIQSEEYCEEYLSEDSSDSENSRPSQHKTKKLKILDL